MISNGIASIIEDRKMGKVTLIPNKGYTMKGTQLTVEEQMILLSLFTNFVRRKVYGAEDED